LAESLAGRCPPSLAGLPSDPFLATRKLARNFVIVEGAFVLMCLGAFKSFGQEAVLRGLRGASHRASRLLDTTAAILSDPYQAQVRPRAFLKDVHPFMDWAITVIENA
jgi:hypothetical protein